LKLERDELLPQLDPEDREPKLELELFEALEDVLEG
jgi:hypothetical protein